MGRGGAPLLPIRPGWTPDRLTAFNPAARPVHFAPVTPRFGGFTRCRRAFALLPLFVLTSTSYTQLRFVYWWPRCAGTLESAGRRPRRAARLPKRGVTGAHAPRRAARPNSALGRARLAVAYQIRARRLRLCVDPVRCQGQIALRAPRRLGATVVPLSRNSLRGCPVFAWSRENRTG